MMCDGSVFSYHREMHLYCDSFYLACKDINQYTKTILCVVTGIRGPKWESIWGHIRWVIRLCPLTSPCGVMTHLKMVLGTMSVSPTSFCASANFCHLLITFANSLDPVQDRQNVGSDLDPNGGMLTVWGNLKQYAKSILSILNINCRHKKSLPDDKFCDMFHHWGNKM